METKPIRFVMYWRVMYTLYTFYTGKNKIKLLLFFVITGLLIRFDETLIFNKIYY